MGGKTEFVQPSMYAVLSMLSAFTRRMTLAAGNIAFGIGAGLPLLNIAGLALSMRSPEIYRHFDDVTLSEKSALQAVRRLPYESGERYVYRLTGMIEQAIAFDWLPPPDNRRFSLHVPVWENWFLWLIGGEYEFAGYRKAIERGTGWCSQHALAEWDALVENGVRAEILHLNGHIVLRALVDGRWYVLDPTWGIVMPYDMPEIERRPEILQSYYPQEILAQVFEIYATPDDNRIFATSAAYLAYSPAVERGFYAFAWLLPMLMMLPAARRLAGQAIRRMICYSSFQDSRVA